MKEAGYCAICGFKDWMVTHHKDRNHSNNNPDNRMKICRSCHTKEHNQEMIESVDNEQYDTLDFINRNKGHEKSYEFYHRFAGY